MCVLGVSREGSSLMVLAPYIPFAVSMKRIDRSLGQPNSPLERKGYTCISIATGSALRGLISHHVVHTWFGLRGVTKDTEAARHVKQKHTFANRDFTSSSWLWMSTPLYLWAKYLYISNSICRAQQSDAAPPQTTVSSVITPRSWPIRQKGIG